MKILLFITLLLTSLFSAEIDAKLFDTKTNSSYFQEIEASINTSKAEGSKSLDMVNAELKHLERLVETSQKKITVDEFDVGLLSVENDVLDSMAKGLRYLAQVQIKQQKQRSLLEEVQNKLALLKRRIEKITEENKDLLLSYQLQYAYYKIQKTHMETRNTLFEANTQKVLTSMSTLLEKSKALPLIEREQEIALIDASIEKALQEKIGVELELERESINENKNKIDLLKKQLQDIEKTAHEALLKKIVLLNQKIIIALAHQDNKGFLNLYAHVESLLSGLEGETFTLHKEQSIVLKKLAKVVFGNTTMLLDTSLTQSIDYMKLIGTSFSATLFVFNEQPISLISIIKALCLIAIGFFIGVMYKKWIYRLSLKWPNMSQMSLKITSNVGFYVIILITIIIAMSSLGIDMSSISLIAGALSIGIGFGLQTVVSNFIAGIILMFERSIRIGDLIEIDATLKGTVTDIRIRSTTIKTFDNIDIVIPNSSFIQNNVINWTLDDKSLRLHVPFGVAYGTEVKKVNEVILGELEASQLVYIKDVDDKKPSIRFEAMNASSVDFELLVWIKVSDKVTPNSLKSDFLMLIYNALYKHHIEIPFPQLDVHLKRGK